MKEPEREKFLLKCQRSVMEENIKYNIKRSRRKTLSIEIQKDGVVLIRAPYSLPNEEIRKFLNEKHDWIVNHVNVSLSNVKDYRDLDPITMEEMHSLADEALSWVPKRVEQLAPLVGVTYGGITIRNQRTRWGSCSSKGNLNFNCLMMLFPEDVRNYIIIHELCHRREMNHSRRFWSLVEQADPDYKEHNEYIRREGEKIMYRAFGYK